MRTAIASVAGVLKSISHVRAVFLMATGWRPHIESALCLDLSRLIRMGSVVPNCRTSGVLRWTRGSACIASIGYHARLTEESGVLTLSYRVNGQEAKDVIRLSSVANHYGGRNWFMHCPATGRRARMLYKWSGLQHFRHREAIRPRPTYASQRDSGTDRINRQRWALRRRMGDLVSDLFDDPIKPKWMRLKTYGRYAARDAELEAREEPHWAGLLARLSRRAGL